MLFGRGDVTNALSLEVAFAPAGGGVHARQHHAGGSSATRATGFGPEHGRALHPAGAVGLTEQWKYFPVIAQKIPNLKDGDWKLLPGNKMQVTWKLKKGFTWHDGK